MNTSRIVELENKVTEIDQLKSALIDLQKTVFTLTQQPNKAVQVPSDEGFPPLQRERSASVVSAKRSCLELDSEEGEFGTIMASLFLKNSRKNAKLR